MGEIEDLVIFTIKRDLTKMTLKISQPHLMTNMTQGLNKDMKSIMIFNTPATPHKRIAHNQETDTTITCETLTTTNYLNVRTNKTQVTTRLFYMQPSKKLIQKTIYNI